VQGRAGSCIPGCCCGAQTGTFPSKKQIKKRLARAQRMRVGGCPGRMPMIPGSFAYHRPSSVQEAVGLLAQHGDEARAIAGGHSLIPMMKLRLAKPGHLVDLGGVSALKGIRADGNDIVIGAMTTQHEVIGSDLLTAKLPILRETALLIADPQVRYLGTLGGNVANGDPGNDMPAVMLCLNASYQVTGKSGERRIAARDFYQGAYFTALEPGEIVTAVRIPVPPAGHGYAYEKLKRKIGDYAPPPPPGGGGRARSSGSF
jgi:carbon-monoxide dehydrogenase medium subunit